MAAIACMLSEHFGVLTAHNLEGAMRLIERPHACRLAYYEVGDDADVAREAIHVLGNAGMEVIALFRPPCPQIVQEAAASGRIQGCCALPICAESFLAQSREILCRLCPAPSREPAQPCLLTREEVKFLLGPPGIGQRDARLHSLG
ncbi:hypothetical protein NY78_2134 [Desulfovibrio sp. TomC]|nr:hypothetical protein NY78_2134 [Desulfovibrio sp. TomC]